MPSDPPSGITPRLLTSAQVSIYLSRSLAWFLGHRAELETRGFPGPVDGCGMRWDRVAIDRWLDQQGTRYGRGPTVEEIALERLRKAMVEPPPSPAARTRARRRKAVDSDGGK